jgi:predicted RNA-binding Zn ribbon-like protein
MAISKDFVFFGRLCLDFAHNGDMGFGSRFERLTSPAELNRWLALSELGLPRLNISSAQLELSKELRSAIWRTASSLLDNVSPAASDVRRINRIATGSVLVRELDLAAIASRWHRPTIEAALATIAQDAVVLFGEPLQRKRMRHCENPDCKAIFYDDSKPGLRRWCASSRCGDRIRARTYRERLSERR